MTLSWKFTAAAMALWLLPGAGVAAEAPDGTFRYVVSHSLHGDVGHLTNTIQRDGPELLVKTQLRITGKVLGIVVRRIEEDRQEIWREGRLIAYESRADDNGEIVVTRGRAEGDAFVIDGSEGRVEAPADLYTATAWSIGMVDARVLMGTKDGDLNRVTITAVGTDPIEVAGRQVPARLYHVRGDTERDLWFDSRGVPLKIAFPAAGGTVSFTLDNENVTAPDWQPARRPLSPERERPGELLPPS
ncbi:MAG: DUF6134 family protein [Alphaproteobacteria bacterium]|nr:DUF6134 family protein [Alphaproteobacteria bacterium]